jgi:calcium-dependent protein kinase
VAGIKDMFEKMDLNKDSMINFDELKLGLHKLGHQMPDADVQILMDAVSNHYFSSLLETFAALCC